MCCSNTSCCIITVMDEGGCHCFCFFFPFLLFFSLREREREFYYILSLQVKSEDNIDHCGADENQA